MGLTAREAPTKAKNPQISLTYSYTHRSTFGLLAINRRLPGSTARCPDDVSERRAFIAHDGGFTSTGVVIALLLTLTLLFSATQVQWLQSTAADIQFVADAGALAGENVVAEYLVIAQTADAIVLSLSLFGLIVFGIAIVVSCIPYCQEVGAKLMDFGKDVLKARDDFAQNAAQALNSLQRVLPFLVAVNAAATINGNQISRDGQQRYLGLALPLPLQGEDLGFANDDGIEGSAEEIGENNAQTAELTDAAEEARQQMQSSKMEGYLADCGNNPNYCLYERAGRLANLSGAENPYFASVDLWTFDQAMARSKAYYDARLAAERPESERLQDQIRSMVRGRYFRYAVQQMRTGYAHTAADGTLDAYFPLLARNASEIRQTELYREAVYPVDGNAVLHGSTACPDYQEAGGAGTGSVAELEAGTYHRCDTCEFGIIVLGNVANATSVTEVGFEYHYRKVAAAAERYQAAAREYRDQTEEAKSSANKAFDALDQALAALDTPRLLPQPPGRNGCIAIVVDTSSHPIPQAFARSFIAGQQTLSPRVAISAAAMAIDQPYQTNTLLGSFLDKLRDDAAGSLVGQGLGVFDKVLELWGWALLSYSQGVEALVSGLGDFLDAIPLVRSTPLASWAENSLRELIQALGLQGSALGTPKPVIVNTLHVAEASQSVVTNGLVQLKKGYSALPGSGSGELLSSTLDGLLGQAEVQGGELLEAEFTVFTIRFGDVPGLPEIPIKVSLPKNIVDQGKSQLSQIRTALQSSWYFGGGYDVWE